METVMSTTPRIWPTTGYDSVSRSTPLSIIAYHTLDLQRDMRSMLDGHLKDVQKIILRQRLESEVRFKDHSRSRRDTMADTTQITRDTNILSRLSAQLNHLNITITELKKGTLNLPATATTIPLLPRPLKP